ncbi:MAG: hypothetical protein JST70_14105 [Bacteroidetes bacterium]|nr:hypothetical protein [Bacteroidota bacterium]
MPLNMGQMDELTRELIQTDIDEGLSSIYLSKKLSVDADVILKSLEDMQRLTYELIFIKHYKDEGFMLPDDDGVDEWYMVKIPKTEKWKAEMLLKDGGWNKKFDDHFEKLNAQKAEETRRLKLEEDSWIATREQAEKAKEQADKANRHSKMANWIAIISAIIALGSFIATIVLSQKL